MMLFTEARRSTAPSPQYGYAQVSESEHDYLIQIEAPGFSAKDIAIKATPHALSIQGELKAKALAGYRTLASSRAPHHRIERKYRFRSRLDSNRVSAKFNNGLLEIRAPKVQVDVVDVPIQNHVIEVESGPMDNNEDDDVI